MLFLKNSRSDLRKSIALADEPDASFGHFVRFTTEIVGQCKSTRPARLTAIRRIYLGLWTLFVWSRTADNTEAAYLSSERAVLMAWDLVKDHVASKSKQGRQLTESMDRLISLPLPDRDDYISYYVEPRAKMLHGLTSAVPTHASLDINLKLFELIGRVGTRGHWLLHIADRLNQQGNVDQRRAVNKALRSTAQLVADMIGSNPVLWSPIKDSQSIDINIACLFLNRVACDHVIREWIGQIAQATVFAFSSQWALSVHLRRVSRFLKNIREVIPSTVLRPPLVASSSDSCGLGGSNERTPRTLGLLSDFTEGAYKHSTLQLLYPGADTEPHLYRGSADHGLAFTGSRLSAACENMLSPIKKECMATSAFSSLSAVKYGLWPLVILASRHHRIPVPPHFWPLGDLNGLR